MTKTKGERSIGRWDEWCMADADFPEERKYFFGKILKEIFPVTLVKQKCRIDITDLQKFSNYHFYNSHKLFRQIILIFCAIP